MQIGAVEVITFEVTLRSAPIPYTFSLLFTDSAKDSNGWCQD